MIRPARDHRRALSGFRSVAVSPPESTRATRSVDGSGHLPRRHTSRVCAGRRRHHRVERDPGSGVSTRWTSASRVGCSTSMGSPYPAIWSSAASASAWRTSARIAGLSCAIERVEDVKAVHAGACLAIWTRGSSGSTFGADRAGKFGRSSEQIARFVAATFLEDVRTGATVDRHPADQLVLFCALDRRGRWRITGSRCPHGDSGASV
jgi:hypothetical protein